MNEPFWIGMTINDVAAISNQKRHQVEHWLRSNGYEPSPRSHKIRRARTVFDIQDAITAQLAAAPPSAPCWRCGCRICACRGSAVAA